jgi:hypothetical protein
MRPGCSPCTLVGMATYDSYVKGKTAEQILSEQQAALDAPIATYLRLAAAVRSDQELIEALRLASDDSSKLTQKIVRLTWVLVGVGLLQAIAIGWHDLRWWVSHGFRF